MAQQAAAEAGERRQSAARTLTQLVQRVRCPLEQLSKSLGPFWSQMWQRRVLNDDACESDLHPG